MSEIKITDLVPQTTLDELKNLDSEMNGVLDTYVRIAKEMAAGLEVKVKVVGDLDKLQNMLVEKSREAAEANTQLNDVLDRQRTVIANTTNTTSRLLMEQERRNKLVREEYADGEKVKGMVEEISNSYEGMTIEMAKITEAIKKNKKEQSDLEKRYKSGGVTYDEYIEKQAKLIAKDRELSLSKTQLGQVMKIQEKLNSDNAGSYNQLSHQLELLKNQYKDMDDSMRNSDVGKEFERVIQELDAHLKDMAADMGEFQRNVGNYAIAGQNGVVATDSLIAVMGQEAKTTQDLIDQTKILEEAKQLLNKEDSNYQSTLDAVNAKIEENKRKLTDVSDILGKEAKSVAEAEAQNKRLSEAIKHIDLSSEDAKKKLEEMRAQIARNNQTIADATGSNEKFADSVLTLIGVNANFGSSFQSLGENGNFIDGLNTKVKAFGKTLTGLLANPWVLAFLGIGGVIAGFKWWYDYNKGLIEATKLTENYTGATGAAADKVTADMQTLADHMGKSYADTIGAANVLVQQFGISWEDATALMEKGLQAGTDMNGNMLNMINQFGPALRDAGVDAEQFIAILSNTRNGIFDEKGVSDILKGGTRLRAMTKQIAESLDACGISSQKMQKDLTEGNITMLEAVQQVSNKLKELPENSQEAGMLMKNVFGRTAAEGGTLLIQSIADIDTNLNSCIDSMGEMGKVTKAQIDAERDLNETISAVFKMSGTSFEEMIGYAKVYVTQWLTRLIKKCVDIYNWFVNIYNEAVHVRVCIGTLVAIFKTLWTVAKAVFDLVINGFKGVAGILEGVMLIFSGELESGMGKIKNALVNGFKGIRDIAVSAGKEIGADFADELSNVAERRLKNVNVSLEADGITLTGSNRPGPDGGEYKPPVDKAAAAKAAKEAEKAAKEELKRIFELEEAKISVMVESHEKEIAMIRLKFKKKIAEITGEGETEIQLRLQLAEQCEKEVADCELKYQQELAKINLENRLAAVKKGSKEELALKLAQLAAEYDAELKEAEKTGADINLITEKFNRKRHDLYEEYSDAYMAAVQKRYTEENETLEVENILKSAAIQKQYNEELKIAGKNQRKREEAERRFNSRMQKLQNEYAAETAQRTIDMYEEMLTNSELSLEDRLEVERKIAKAKAELEKLKQEIISQPDAGKEEQITPEDIAQQFLGATADAFNSINDLSQQLFDNQIGRIEALQEQLEETRDMELEQVTDLVEKKVITEEEGEARKRAAEAKTARESEKLEMKKQQLKIKQAKWDKANSIAQATISTALAVMNALQTKPFWMGITMAAIAGAMGAMQIATIAATPIPAYAKGTEHHKGGPAIVGDGGRPEVVLFNGSAWVTPDTPTLVDMPVGAKVLPEMPKVGNELLEPIGPYRLNDSRIEFTPYDDTAMRRAVSELAMLLKLQTRTQRQIAYDAEYERYKNSRI